MILKVTDCDGVMIEVSGESMYEIDELLARTQSLFQDSVCPAKIETTAAVGCKNPPTSLKKKKEN